MTGKQPLRARTLGSDPRHLCLLEAAHPGGPSRERNNALSGLRESAKLCHQAASRVRAKWLLPPSRLACSKTGNAQCWGKQACPHRSSGWWAGKGVHLRRPIGQHDSKPKVPNFGLRNSTGRELDIIFSKAERHRSKEAQQNIVFKNLKPETT